MEDTRLTLTVEDVAAGASFFRDVLALPVHQRDASHVEVDLGGVTATLTSGHPGTPGRPGTPGAIELPTGEPAGTDGRTVTEGRTGSDGRTRAVVATGNPAVILEIEVGDVGEALRELRRRGATVLLEPVLTDWGTESAFVAGPDGVVVEIYRERYQRRH